MSTTTTTVINTQRDHHPDPDTTDTVYASTVIAASEPGSTELTITNGGGWTLHIPADTLDTLIAVLTEHRAAITLQLPPTPRKKGPLPPLTAPGGWSAPPIPEATQTAYFDGDTIRTASTSPTSADDLEVPRRPLTPIRTIQEVASTLAADAPRDAVGRITALEQRADDVDTRLTAAEVETASVKVEVATVADAVATVADAVTTTAAPTRVQDWTLHTPDENPTLEVTPTQLLEIADQGHLRDEHGCVVQVIAKADRA